MAALEKLEAALRKQTGRELYDNALNLDCLWGILANMDSKDKTLENMSGRRFSMSKDVAGKSRQVDFRTGLPVAQGASPVTGSLASLELSTQENIQTQSGEMGWSYYQAREDVRTALIEQMTKDVSKNIQWVKMTAEALRDAIRIKVMSDIIPAADVTTAGQGAEAENKIMAIGYPLQNATSGTYSYLGLNMADAEMQRSQAVRSGTTGSAFGVMSLSNLRKKILLPLKPRGGKPDIVLCDADVFDYVLSQAEGKLVLAQEDTLEYGGENVRYGGRYWCYEPLLDDVYDTTTYRQTLFLQSDTWEFTWKEFGNDSLSLSPHDKTNFLQKVLWACACQLICYNPRKNAVAYNVTLS